MKLFLFLTVTLDMTVGTHFYKLFKNKPPPPSPSPPPPYKNPSPTNPSPSYPPHPPGVPLNACKIFIPNLCDSLLERNYFDVNCYSNDDPYGGLGCNAGGLICCRFCEFSQYKSVPCILSPSQPPLSPPPPSPPPSPPPKNPLIIPIGDKIIDPNKAKINFHMRIESDIETFNIKIFEERFFKVFKRIIPYNQVKFNFRPGSLLVDVSIITNITLLENTSSFIDTISSNDLSEELNVTIVEMTPAIVEKYNYDNIIIQYNYDSIYILIIILSSLFILFLTCCIKYTKNFNKKEKQKLKQKQIDTLNINRLSGLAIYNSNLETQKNFYDC